MKEVPKDFASNWFHNCIQTEDFMYVCDTRPPEPAAFVEIGCALPNDSEKEASDTENIDEWTGTTSTYFSITLL